MATYLVQKLFFGCMWFVLLVRELDAVTAYDCFNTVYKTKVVTNTADTPVDPVTACAADGQQNYMPFTLCNQKLWLTAELEFYKSIAPGSRMFIGFSDALQTMDYYFMGDGGFVFNDTLQYFVDGPESNDTRKSCVALQFPTEQAWRTPKCTDPNVPHFSACEASVCKFPWKSVPLGAVTKICYKTDSQRTFDQAASDCRSLNGKLLQLSTFADSIDAVTQMARDFVANMAGQRGVTLWLADASCRSWGNGLYMERVACDFVKGDKYMCMIYNPSSGYAGSYKGCFAVPAANKGLVASTDAMQVRYCISLCQGQGRKFAGLRNLDCFCLDTITATATEICSTSCPGNPGQLCGGPNSMAVFDSISYFGAAADTCIAYFEMGFYPPAGYQVTFKTKAATLISCSLETLIPPSGVSNFRPCPTGFVMLNKSCLYFGHNETMSNEAQRICLTMQADLAYMDDERLQFVRMTVKRPRSFSRHDAWNFGAYSLENQFWTWRDGRPMRTQDAFGVMNNNVGKAASTTISYLLRENNALKDNVDVVDLNKESAFICSWNDQFLGQRDPVLDDGFVAKHQSTVNMSVTACIQLCLLNSRRQVAQVFGDTCICSLDTIIVSSDPLNFECQSPFTCPGHGGQICGCDGKASFYYTDPALIQPYYNCSELEANGVGVNGVYTVMDPVGRDPEYTELCLFSRGTCPDELPYLYRNKCYSGNGQLQMHHQAAKYCANLGYHLAVPNDDDEERFLVHLMERINGPQAESWLGTVNHEGHLYNITADKDMLKMTDDEDQCLYLSSDPAPNTAFGDCENMKNPICQSANEKYAITWRHN